MSTVHRNTWMTGWTADDPLQDRLRLGREGRGHLGDGRTVLPRVPRPGLAGVTDGKMGAQHIRCNEAVETDWHCHDLDFQFVYVVKGKLEIENQHGEKVTLGPADTLYHPPLYCTARSSPRATSASRSPRRPSSRRSPAATTRCPPARPTSTPTAAGSTATSAPRSTSSRTARAASSATATAARRARARAASTSTWSRRRARRRHRLALPHDGAVVHDRRRLVDHPRRGPARAGGRDRRHDVHRLGPGHAPQRRAVHRRLRRPRDCVPGEYETTAVPPPDNAAPTPEGAID